jgi:hypothetical protein
MDFIALQTDREQVDERVDNIEWSGALMQPEDHVAEAAGRHLEKDKTGAVDGPLEGSCEVEDSENEYEHFSSQQP